MLTFEILDYPNILAISLLFNLVNLHIALRLFHLELSLYERVLSATAFGAGIFASTLVTHLPVLANNNSYLQSTTLLAAFMIPAILAYGITFFQEPFAKIVALSIGVVGCHFAISDSHPNYFYGFLLILTIIIFVLSLMIAEQRKPRFKLLSGHYQYWCAVFVGAVGLSMTLIPTESEIGIVITSSKGHDIPALISMLAAAGLILLYLNIALAIKNEKVTLWRPLLAIVVAEFGIMFLLPPFISKESPVWLEPLVDGTLLSLFAFPLLLRHRVVANSLNIALTEIKTTLFAISDGVIVCNKDGRVRYINRSAEGLLGLSSQQISGQELTAVFQVYDEENKQLLIDPLTRCLKEQTIIALSNHAVLKSAQGEMTAVEHAASPIFDKQGGIAGAILICRDVTAQRKQQQRQRQESELLQLLNALLILKLADTTLEQLMQSSLDSVLALSWLPIQRKGGIFLSKEDKSLELISQTGLSEQVQQHCAHIQLGYCLCGRSAQQQATIFKSCLDDEHEFQHAGMAEHGHYSLPLYIDNETLGVMVLYINEDHPYHDWEHEALETISKTIANIIKRKVGMQARQLARQILDHSHQGVMVANADNVIIDINPSFTDITGYTLSEVKGKSPSLLNSGRQSQEFYSELWQSITEHGFWQGEIWNRNKEGLIYPEWLTINVLKEPNGKVQNYIGIFTDLTAIKKAEDNIVQLAYFDTLTSLPNRTQFYEVLTQAKSNAQRNHHYLAILFMDLDRFKGINDTLGHLVGDNVLTIVGKRLTKNLREGDIAARWGGDEFVILLQADTLTDIKRDASHVADKLLTALKLPISSHDHVFNLSASIGVTIYPEDSEDQELLIQYADVAMYRVKQECSGNYLFFSSELNEQLQRQRVIELALTSAIPNNEFELVYQPKVLTRTGEIIGFEALLRWTSTELGAVSPAEFIPIAEDSKLIVDIDEWVFDHVCMQLQFWMTTGLCQHGQHISVNLASRHLQDPAFINQIILKAKQYDIPPKSLQIEITETGLMDQTSIVIDHLTLLKESGFSIAMDDFGTGHSSLSRLKDLPIDLLKIDRSFIQEMTSDENDQAIVQATIQMAHTLGIEVCAEGVETKEHAEILKQFDCRYAQGYLYAKPVSAKEAENYLVE